MSKMVEYKPGSQFPGVIGRTWDKSTPAWPAPLRAKQGAPNVLFIILDDVGFGHLSFFGGLVQTLNGDNSTLQTWSFGKCQITNYEPYLDESALTYKLHLKWHAEIKDRTTFSCSGLNLGLG